MKIKYFYQLVNGSMIDISLINFTKKVDRRTMDDQDYYWAVIKGGSPEGTYMPLTEKEFNEINNTLKSYYTNINLILEGEEDEAVYLRRGRKNSKRS